MWVGILAFLALWWMISREKKHNYRNHDDRYFFFEDFVDK